MRSDFHLHSSFSADSDAPMRDMVEKGISLGLSAMCFTEHMDYDYIDEGMVFEADIPSYCKTLTSLKEEYEHKIELLFGLELGLQPYLKERCESLVKNWDFDFVIGSSHVVNGQDPYYPAFFEGRTEKESYISYFESIIENLHTMSCFDVYGHIDYVVRYGPNKNQFYSYKEYSDWLDERTWHGDQYRRLCSRTWTPEPARRYPETLPRTWRRDRHHRIRCTCPRTYCG